MQKTQRQLTNKQELYWKKRQKFDKSFLKFEEKQLSRNAIRYDNAVASSRKSLKAFYTDFGHDSVVVYTDAITPIRNKTKIVAEIKKELNRVKDTADTQYINNLKNLLSQKKISRLDALNFEIEKNVHDLAINSNLSMSEYLSGSYEKAYKFQTIALNELAKKEASGIIYKTRVQKAVFAEFKGSSFSDRIWNDKNKLVDSLRSTLSDMFVQQKHIKDSVKLMERRFNVSRSSAERIIRTEGARITEEATRQVYAEHDIVKYEYDATLDERTSNICEELNGTIHNLSEAQAGVNYPPMHPNCRSTTIPVF